MRTQIEQHIKTKHYLLNQNLKKPNIVMKCANCNTLNDADARFCKNCGQPLDQICLNCGTHNDSEANFCKSCGTRLGDLAYSTTGSPLQELKKSAPESLQDKMRAASREIEGQRKPVTILFSDIVGSTSLAEKLDPEEWKEITSVPTVG